GGWGASDGAGGAHLRAEMVLARPFLWVETVPRVDRPSFRWQIWRWVCSPCTWGPVLRLLSPVVRRGRHGRPGRCGGGPRVYRVSEMSGSGRRGALPAMHGRPFREGREPTGLRRLPAERDGSR